MHKIVFLISILFISSTVQAELIRFGSDVTHAKWSVTGSKEECRLQQKVRDYGVLSFIQRAGRSVHYNMYSWHNARKNLEASLTLVPPKWRHELKPRKLKNVKLKAGRTVLNLDTYYTQKLIIALESGMIVRMQYPLKPRKKENTFIVDASTVNFRAEYDNFQQCIEKLLPYDFEEISFMSIYFKSESIELDKPATKVLNKVIHYVKAGAKISKIVISGFTDKRGRYHYNRKLARARGEKVRSYFLIHEIPESLLKVEDTTRRGGYTFSDHIADEKNRRVTIRLVH